MDPYQVFLVQVGLHSFIKVNFYFAKYEGYSILGDACVFYLNICVSCQVEENNLEGYKIQFTI